MDKKVFGRTGLEVSRLTFGCGAVGGLMVKGEAADQDRAVAWARDNGINFFDTLHELVASGRPTLPTTEIGIATIDELQRAAAAVNRGPLPAEALARIKQIQASFTAAPHAPDR
jgi:aryl-alcohol dehydrogenase-like predicted oxidoreductase